MRGTKILAEPEVAWEECKELAFHSLYSASDQRADGIQADQNNDEATKTGSGIPEGDFNILKQCSLLLLLLFRIARNV